MTGRNGARGVGTICPPAAAHLETLEARWILPGRRPAALTRWFARFCSTTEEREDLYLIDPQQAGMSVKVRGSSLLELKMQRDDTRILDVPGFATAGVRYCEKWSFLLAVAGATAPPGRAWKPVFKSRLLSRFSPAGEAFGPDGSNGGRPACEAELTDILVDGQAWWTLALEAAGSGGEAWDAMNAAAGTLFADPLPPGVRPRASDAVAYSEWLRSRSGATGG